MVKTDAKHRQGNKFRRNIMALVAATVVSMALLIFCFSRFSEQYQKKVEVETSGHMMEITNQISSYVEDNMNNNWVIAEGLAAGLNLFTLNREGDIQRLLEQTREMGRMADVYLYTEDGSSYSVVSSSKSNDASSDLVYDARNKERYLSITESSVTYTVPVYTQTAYRGSEIVAISVIQDMETLISDMDVSSFGQTASLFLVQENGTVIGQLQPDGRAPLYNVYSIFKDSAPVCLNRPDFVMDGVLPNDQTYSFLLHGGADNQYVVTNVCKVGDSALRLFYCVPESAANVNSNEFIENITMLTVGISVAFLLVVSFFFVVLFVNQHREMNQKLDMRQHMIDLLIANTGNAFALLSVREKTPLYLSSNIGKITDVSSVRLVRTETGFRLETEGGADPANVTLINEQLASWDGATEYASPYLHYQNRYGQACYFMVRIYATEKAIPLSTSRRT